jgi:hypothetical protein
LVNDRKDAASLTTGQHAQIVADVQHELQHPLLIVVGAQRVDCKGSGA